jgi:hypothetical protein
MHARAAVEIGTQGVDVSKRRRIHVNLSGSFWLAVSGFAAQRVLHKASSAPSRLVVLYASSY